ncbi:MAG: DUF6298 domain-containing protein [Tannerella sp.]|jgi:hypothetical protein|nr:DUF6298 domain-containing protein [Tannerella sp.]
MKIQTYFLLFFLAGINICSLRGDDFKPIPPIEFLDGKLFYNPDSLGNRIPDFSYAGYMAGEKDIPDVGIKAVVPLTEGDATEIIQKAIDYVGAMTPDTNGFRGTVLLLAGDYNVSGSIFIKNSGIILRGCGTGDKGTKVIATGKDRRTLIQILGNNNKKNGDSIPVRNAYVPVNAITLDLPDNHGLNKGDNITVFRPSVNEWIEKTGTGNFGGGISYLGWKPGDIDLFWDRTVTSVNKNRITIDAPITTALDKQYGGGYVIPYTWLGRISNTGVENLTCISEYDVRNPKDEAHSWVAIHIENAYDAWVRCITFKHFAGSAVMIAETSRRITVENCKSLQPVSEIGGQRRHTFFTMGQQCLFNRIYSEQGYHDFATGYCATGPNAFVQCQAERPHSFSGATDCWASGVLFDVVNIDGNALSFKNKMQSGQGAGWCAANSVFWQCTASLIECFSPPTAQNWSFGSWAEFSGDGYWENSNNHINPRSLYFRQLSERLEDKNVETMNIVPYDKEASTSPSIENAAEWTEKTYHPLPTLSEWIDKLQSENNINISFDPSLIYNEKNKHKKKQSAETHPLTIKNGLLVRNTEIQSGGKHEIRWWSGSVRPNYLKNQAIPHITRFVPGRNGTGLTDCIDSVIRILKRNNTIALDHNYGLWYDRRRDDHERIRRMDGDVWSPFYEQPFARSGQGVAYDGLSKYDLTKYNPWYWNRLRQFVDQADKEGLILVHQHYFQHNILEAGAHWTDSPWRPANNINDTGFPEPAPYAGDKRVFIAEQFYDISHPVRKILHEKYIRQCLDNFKGQNNVIQLISAEYTGPLHFVEFWIDVITEWERETGEKQLIALSTTKDVQDAILADPDRSKIIDIIDIRYWFYRNDNTTYEPKGGQNLAPRQHARLVNPGKASFASVYRAVHEYRQKYPDKAVVYYADSYTQQAWASFMAGGSLSCLPPIEDKRFLQHASSMSAINEMNTDTQYVTGNPEKGYIIYSVNGNITLNMENKHRYKLVWINPETGEITNTGQQVNGKTEIKNPLKQAVVVWLIKL